MHKSKSWVSKRLAADHPDLAWQARKLLEEGITEDLELILTVHQIAKLDYCEANQLMQKIQNGKAGRETARERLATVKTKEGAKNAQRKAIEAERNDPETIARREAKQQAAKEQLERELEEERQKWHVDPDCQMYKFWDWCAKNPDDNRGARDGGRTRTASGREILSLLCLPISPPGHGG